MPNKTVSLAAGGGGKAMSELIGGLLFKYFKNNELHEMRDASYLSLIGELAFSTDSFIITPEVFPGGDIGKLAVAGTTNDLACSGAIPRYLSCSLIISEGYDLSQLELVIASMAAAADEAGVDIVTGDTKVVPHGELSGLFINTAGIGVVAKRTNDYANIKAGDKIIITSDIARHGVAVFLARKELGFTGQIESDCNILCNMLNSVLDYGVHFIRDATRGGVAAVLNEVAERSSLGVLLRETQIPLREDVSHFCDTLGFDPLAVANEGVAVVIVDSADADQVLSTIRSHSAGVRAAICGEVTANKGVLLETVIGGKRYVEMPLGEILPRIC
ncbi:MAG: hydrogenase expression/formation protein HypE [Deferribacteraceae bacterium]|jgi:hydrogenase expression/formation protein HypE|nr:hydrogenase expression/formation protein HypE [Deferribacteraceae bacterium]